MDSNSWNACLSSISKRYQPPLHSPSEIFMGQEEIDGDDDIREEFPCPFCSEFFDIIGLCCHIDDDHPVEAKNAVCPVCATRVGVGMVAHLTMQHRNMFKVQRKRKSRKSGSHSSTLSLLREIQEGNFPPVFGNSSYIVSSNAQPDPLLSSFISPAADELISSESLSFADTISTEIGKDDNLFERNVSTPTLSIEDQKERTRRSEFTHSLLFSTIFDDEL